MAFGSCSTLIILLNIFIAIVSVEYERLEKAVINRYEEQIDHRLAQLVKSRLSRAPQIGISRAVLRELGLIWNNGSWEK